MEEKQLLPRGGRILLAVSGGIDSVVMAHLFADTEHECALAHCNFQLRGAESEADEAFVRELAGRLEMPLFVERFDVEAEMEEKGVSLQMAARNLRYGWFDHLMDQHNYAALATAHNLNDAVETYFLNLSRGTGVRGLRGIPSRNGRVIRPLLFASRKDIEAYAEKGKIRYREDRSNREIKYQRNKVRHDVIPHMENLNPSFLDSMALHMQRMEELGTLLDQSRERVKKQLFKREGNLLRISLDDLKDLDPRSTWIYELFSPYGFNRQQCEGIEKMLGASPGKRILSASHQLFRDRDELMLLPQRQEGFDRYYLDSPEKASSLPFAMDVEVVEREALKAIPREPYVACLDYEQITFPLTLRHWLPGDYFCPLGMDGQIKKLSDFFVDEKVPLPEKDRIWLLASDRKIVWILNHRIDHRFRIAEDTRKVLLLRLHPDV